MPITIQVTGFARSAAVKLHTLDMSGVSAPFANRNPALRSLNPEITFVIIKPAPETAPEPDGTLDAPVDYDREDDSGEDTEIDESEGEDNGNPT